jgi:DNA/RNA endonuclease G (NUC1)
MRTLFAQPPESPIGWLVVVIFAALALGGCASRTTRESPYGVRRTTVTNHVPSGKRSHLKFKHFEEKSAPVGQVFTTRFDIALKVTVPLQEPHCPFGQPVARAGIDFGPTEFVWREGYDLLHSAELKTPYWVCERYTFESLKKNFERGSKSFKPDPLLHLARAERSDYAGSSQYILGNEPFPIDIGHMAPAEAHTSTEQLLLDTFYFSNAVPQHRSMNRGQWAKLEECARASSPTGGIGWVISGPMIYSADDVDQIAVNTIGDGVVVPTHTWKIFVSQKDNEPLTVWAAVMPNQKLPVGSELQDFEARIDDIEDATGFDFLPELPEDEQNELESVIHEIPCQ